MLDSHTDSPTLATLMAALGSMPEAAPLVIFAPSGPIGAGYHLTELKRARIDSVDCGGRISRWDEAVLQAFDVTGEVHIKLGKALAILTRAAHALPGVADLPLAIEFGPGNASLQRFDIADLALVAGQAHLTLRAQTATCKVISAPTPLAPMGVPEPRAASGCC